MKIERETKEIVKWNRQANKEINNRQANIEINEYIQKIKLCYYRTSKAT